MLKKVKAELRNEVGIKMFGKPIRHMETNTLNIRQIFTLLREKRIVKLHEVNEDETLSIEINMKNYDKETDWNKIKEVAPSVKQEIKNTDTAKRLERDFPPKIFFILSENISHPSDCVNELPFETVIYFISEPFYGDVYNICFCVEVNIPYLFGNVSAPQNFVFVCRKQAQKIKFLFGKIYVFAAARNFMFNCVYM